MKLSSISRSEMGKILEIGMVDTGSDILFPDLHRCDIRNDKLYLIIGIGGSGMAMLKETKRLADRRLNPGYEPFMKFLAVDAAPSELQVVEGLGIPTLNFLIPGAAERLRKENRSDFFKKFVPLDYDLKKLTGEGGAADRVTGKIRLYDTHGNTTNDKLFVQRIQSLFYESQNLLPDYYSVNIVILSGTTGGMGSGAFLDLAVRAKAAFPDPGRVQVYGCLMLPDTLRYKSFLADMQMLSGLYGNGYAALKELERYMCICLANDGRTVVLEAPDPQDNVTLSASNLPFDCPFLLSGKFEEAVSTAAELIINLAVNHHDDIGLEARITHLDWARQNLLADGTLRQNVFSEDSHAYLNVGYAYAAIPQTTAVSFVIGSVGKRLYLPDGAGKSLGESGWRALFFRENGINKTDFEKQVRFLLVLDDESPLQGDSFWKKIRAKIQECCRPGESEQEITYRDLQYGNVGDYLRGFHIKEAADEVIRQMTEELERFYREFLHRAESIMEEFGPGMMVRLYEGYGNKDEEGRWEDFSEICIKTQIKEVVVGLNMVKQIPVEYPESNISQENRQPLFSYKRNMIVEEWKGRAKAAAGADIKRRVSADMLEAVNEWYERIKYFVFRCERFAAVLETLTEFYVNRGNAAADSLSRVFVDEMNQPNMLNLCSVPEVSQWVRYRAGQIAGNGSLSQMKSSLIQDFMENQDEWCSDKRQEARNRFDRIMAQSCGLGIYAANAAGFTIADYFTDHYADFSRLSEVGRVNTAEQIARDMLNKLLNLSDLSRYMKPDELHNLQKTVILPQSLVNAPYGDLLRQAFETCLTEMGEQLRVSPYVESIVCCQLSAPNSLSGLKELPTWKAAYERTMSAD